jgi:hypothetical protein
LPGADRDCLKALVGYAMFSKSQLAGIDHIVKRARFEAQKAGREVTLADVKSAIERRLPVDPEASGVRIEEAPPKSKRPQLVRSPLLAPAPVEAGREESRISFEEFPSNA